LRITLRFRSGRKITQNIFDGLQRYEQQKGTIPVLPQSVSNTISRHHCTCVTYICTRALAAMDTRSTCLHSCLKSKANLNWSCLVPATVSTHEGSTLLLTNLCKRLGCCSTHSPHELKQDQQY